MQRNSVLLENLTVDQLQQLIGNSVKNEIEELQKHFKPAQLAEYLTRQQVADTFNVDLSTVHNWCKSGKLKPLGIGSRVYSLRTDIEAALIPFT